MCTAPARGYEADYSALMRGPVKKRLGEPDDRLEFDHGYTEWVALGDLTVGRTVAQPGWRWSTHIKPVVGGEWCRSDLGFVDRWEHTLKGVSGARRIFAVAPPASPMTV